MKANGTNQVATAKPKTGRAARASVSKTKPAVQSRAQAARRRGKSATGAKGKPVVSPVHASAAGRPKAARVVSKARQPKTLKINPLVPDFLDNPDDAREELWVFGALIIGTATIILAFVGLAALIKG